MSEPQYHTFTLKERPELRDEAARFAESAWPAFLRARDILHWSSLFTTFAEYQLFLCVAEGPVIGIAHTVPLLWDGSLTGLPPGIDDIMARAIECQRREDVPNTLSALAMMIEPERRGHGFSMRLLRATSALAKRHAFRALIAPVRPNWKARYPLTPFGRYVNWKRADGAPYDPWLRVHYQAGGQPLRIAAESLTVTGTVCQWEQWAGMSFPETGDYVVPGALKPVTIDREQNKGVYIEPNLWITHAPGLARIKEYMEAL